MTATELAAIVREHTAREIAAALVPILAEKAALELRVKELELRQPVVGERGENGPPGLHGAPGRDGTGVVEAILDRAGHLVLTLSDGRTKDVGLVTGQDGKAGPPGVDGMTLEDASLVCDAEGWKLRLSAGGRTKDYPLPLPHDVGPWVPGPVYPGGAAVSWDGGYWVAKSRTTDQPGTSDVWRCVVRRGKQGKEGPRGKDGRDMTPSNTPALYS